MIKVITLPYNLDCPLKLQNLQELVIWEDICRKKQLLVLERQQKLVLKYHKAIVYYFSVASSALSPAARRTGVEWV